jgi:hypothetical protein
MLFGDVFLPNNLKKRDAEAKKIGQNILMNWLTREIADIIMIYYRFADSVPGRPPQWEEIQ